MNSSYPKRPKEPAHDVSQQVSVKAGTTPTRNAGSNDLLSNIQVNPKLLLLADQSCWFLEKRRWCGGSLSTWRRRREPPCLPSKRSTTGHRSACASSIQKAPSASHTVRASRRSLCWDPDSSRTRQDTVRRCHALERSEGTDNRRSPSTS
jgi:hypothetical protein